MEPMNILICEDEHLLAIDLSARLEAQGHSVIGIASNEQRVYEIIKQSRPDLAIMDVHLDDGSRGTDIARRIAVSHHIPSVFLTGDSEATTIEESKGPLSLGYLLKPVRDKDLMCTIELAMSRHRYYEDLCSTMYGGMPLEQGSSVSVPQVAHSLADAFSTLSQYADGTDSVREDVRVIERSIYQLLVAHGRDCYDMDWISARDLMTSSITLLKSRFPNALFDFQASSEMEMVMENLSIYGDKEALQFVLLQLGANAYEALQEAELLESEPIRILTNLEFRKQVHSEKATWCYVIYVIDGGAGLGVGADKAFTPYVSSKTGSGHLGLGLTIADQIVRHHNGGVSLELQKQRGVRAAMYLALVHKGSS